MYALAGELTLVTIAGQQLLLAGDSAVFPGNTPDGYHMINRSTIVYVYLDIGTHCAGHACSYSGPPTTRTRTQRPIPDV